MRITKSEYCAALNSIINYQKTMRPIQKALMLDSENPLSQFENDYINTIVSLADDDEDYTSYFLYSLNCGKGWHPGAVTMDNHDVRLDTPERLYDFIAATQHEHSMPSSHWLVNKELGHHGEVLSTTLVCDRCGHLVDLKDIEDYTICPHCSKEMY